MRLSHLTVSKIPARESAGCVSPYALVSGELFLPLLRDQRVGVQCFARGSEGQNVPLSEIGQGANPSEVSRVAQGLHELWW